MNQVDILRKILAQFDEKINYLNTQAKEATAKENYETANQCNLKRLGLGIGVDIIQSELNALRNK